MDLFAAGSPDLASFVLSAIVRIAFLLYWLFDNLAILSKIKVITMDTKALGKKGATFWFIALLAQLILTIKNIIVNTKKIDKIKSYFFILNVGLL